MNTSVVSQNLDLICTRGLAGKVYSDNITLLQDTQSSFKAKVYIMHLDGYCVVIKDYNHAHPLIRDLVCKWLISREIEALSRLHTHPAVPAFKGKHGPFAFAMELINGQIVSKSLLKKTPYLVEQLTRYIQDIHSYGVTHNDIRMRNILIDNNHKLHIIDFAGAMLKSKQAYRISTFFFQLTKFIECVKLVRLRRQYLPQTLNKQEQMLVKFIVPLKIITRSWKKYVYRFLKLK